MASSFGSTINSSLENALNMGASRTNEAIGSTQSGVNAVLSNAGQVAQSANQMRNQANLVNSQGNAVNSTAGDIKSLAGQMTPYADELSGIGDTLLTEGSTLWNQSQDVFGQGGALVNMDQSAGGLAAEFIKQYNLLSPDRYVAQAASDTQGSFSNAWDQMVRGNARQGVSASSGNAQALKRQYAQSLATALAAAKTKARQTGIDEQTKMLSTMTGAANTLYNMGNTTAQSALSAQNAGASAKDKAAGVFGSAASAQAQAGSLQAQAGTLYSNAASIIGSASNLETNQAELTMNAYKSLAAAQQAASEYYAKAASVEVGANTGKGGGGWSTTNGNANNWVKSSSGRDETKYGSPWTTTWTNTKTGATATGDGLFNPNNG